MSSLRDRLGRLERGAAGSPAAAPEPAAPEPASPEPQSGAELRRRLDRILGPGRVVTAAELRSPPRKPPPAPPAPLESLVPGRRELHLGVPVFTGEWLVPAAEVHGNLPLTRLAALHRSPAAELFPEHLAEVRDPGAIVYLDTETTGLAGGAGTIPFLIGIGRWVEEPRPGFHVLQFFLEELHQEGAQLEALTRHLAGAACVVTYNGKAYDLPLLENRYVLQHREYPLRGVPHLDLLHPARALWAADHPDCRLATLETSLLGFRRSGDVPGAQIPPLYRRFLAAGPNTELAGVFRHNRDDLLSLAGLLLRAGETLHAGSPRERGAAGLLLARRGRHTAAAAALEAGLGSEVPRAQRWRVLRELVTARRAVGDWSGTLDLLRQLGALRPADPFPVTESAKVLDLRLGDPQAALQVLDRALQDVLWTPRDRERLERRRDRLRAKLGPEGR